MNYLQKELHRQRIVANHQDEAKKNQAEAKKIAETLHTDASFLKPDLKKYSALSVVDLFTAACLISGINPAHLFMKSHWRGAAEYVKGDAAAALKRLMDFYTFALNQFEVGELRTVGARRDVALTSFAALAVSKGITLPKGFPFVAPPTTENPKTPIKVSKDAMINLHKHQWPTIERDMADAAKNGLASARAGAKRGWQESIALDWARANNKLVSGKNADLTNTPNNPFGKSP